MADRLNIDFETRSTVDLKKVGSYRYATDPSTDVWCMAWAVDDEEPELWTPGMLIPERYLDLVMGDRVEIRAWNAEFERVITWLVLGRRYGWPKPPREQFVDTAAEAAAMALPRKLEKAAKVLGLSVEKDMGGNRLAIQMAKPRKPRKGEPTDVVMWWDDDERRQKLYAYCKQDVRVEREVSHHLRRLSDHERRIYLHDQVINDRGVRVDVPLIRASLDLANEAKDKAGVQLAEVTGGAVTAVTQTNEIRAFCGLDSVAKDIVRDILDEHEDYAHLDMSETQRAVLQLRQDFGKSSTGKLEKFIAMLMSDDRIRGLLLYHGAGTGRWSGRGVQPQNFPRPTVKDVEQFIDAVLARDYEAIEREEPVLHVLASLLRSMIVASPGCRLMAADFAQIEARVLAWIAEQLDLIEAFAKGAKVYENMAGLIYGRPAAEIINPSEERTVGKESVLGFGFQMGEKAFQANVQKKTGIRLSDEVAARAKRVYRGANDRIVQFWWDIERAAMDAVRRPGTVMRVGRGGAIRYVCKGRWLWCILPSGRPLAYRDPIIKRRMTQWGEKVGLQVMTQSSKTHQWSVQHVYGGFLTENVVQAMARDLMASAMLRVEKHGYPVVLTVHDEVLGDVPVGHGSLEEYEALMRVLPRWAEGLPVKAESWEGGRYRK